MRVVLGSDGREDLPVRLRRGFLQRRVPVVAGPGTVRLGDGNAAEQQLAAAPEAHPLVLARLGRLTAPPYLEEVSGSRQNRGTDVRKRNSRRSGDLQIRGAR